MHQRSKRWPSGIVVTCLAIVFSLSCAELACACDQIPAGETFRARLVQPVSSYSSKRGSIVRAILIESPQCNDQPIFPGGTPVEGHVESVHKVGLGLRHEVATLEIRFDRIAPAGAAPIPIGASVLEVDNARERVRNGVIHGIRSFNSPQDHLSGRITYLMTWHPDTFWILPIYHAAFPVLPEPEIYFPSGTDFLVKLSTAVPVTDISVPASADRQFEFAPDEIQDLNNMVLSFPERSTTPKGRDADFVNLAFVGSPEQLADAFESAGWNRGQFMSRRAAFGEINAFLMLRNYAHGPMSRQLLQGQPSDSSWEKGLDSIAKRDHLRIWSTSATWRGETVWLSASTRDVSANLSMRKARFVHQVDPNIDEERERVVRDLKLAGCVASVDEVARPDMPHFALNATGGAMVTDGAVAVLHLKDCSNPAFRSNPEGPLLAARPKSGVERYLRTQVLSARDMWRENVVYDIFNVSRVSVRAIRTAELKREVRVKSAALADSTDPVKP